MELMNPLIATHPLYSPSEIARTLLPSSDIASTTIVAPLLDRAEA